MAGSVLCGISIALLFFNVNLSGELKTAYYIIINIIFWASMTSCVIPHISLGTDLTDDYHGRTGVRAYATLMLNTGTLIATSITLMIVKFYSAIFMDTDTAWLFMGITYGVLVLLVYQTSCWALRGKEPPNPNIAKPNDSSKIHPAMIICGYIKTLTNKPMMSLLTITFVTNFVVGVASSLVIFIFTYLYGYDEAQSSFMFFYQGVLYVIFVAIVTYMSKRIGKKTTMLLGQGCYSLSYLIMFLLPATVPVLFANITIAAFGNVIYWTLIYSMTYDATLIEQFKSGDNPTGVYVSMIGFIMKAGTSIGMFVVGLGLDMIGFSPDAAQQAESTLNGLKTMYSIIPTVALLIGTIAAVKYGLTKEKYDKLLSAYERKQSSEPYSIDEISDLL